MQRRIFSDDKFYFNPRSRKGSDTKWRSSVILLLENFNPRSHEGSDHTDNGTNKQNQISIHAPARGATSSADRSVSDLIYFNPRSREGSDNHTALTAFLKIYFNPRSREGSDSNFYPKSYLILGKNCLKLLKSLNISILQNIFKHSMTYFQVRISPSIYVSLAFAPNL